MNRPENGISIVIPVYNEEGSLPRLNDELHAVLRGIKQSYEIIFIDDGSIDNSFKILSEISRKDKRVVVIKFQRNFGKSAALNAGFAQAMGRVVITMDADLQNDPADIPLFLKKIEEGYHLVNGWRHSRKDPFLSKVLPSFISNWIVRKLIGLNIHDYVCPFKAYKSEIVKSMKLYGEMHRYIPAFAVMSGFSVTEIKINHRRRLFGETKYNLTRLSKGFLDLLYIKFWMTYGTRPVHFFGLLGLLQYFLGGLIVLEQIIKALIVKSLDLGPLLLLSVMLAITGTLFILVGFLGEIIIRTYYASTGESYIIERVLKKSSS